MTRDRRGTLSSSKGGHSRPGQAGTAPEYYRPGVWRGIARFYDPLMKLALLPCGGERRFRRRCLDFAGLQEGEGVLDLCCGTGALTLLIAERVGPSGRVVGVDLSEAMLQVANKNRRGRAWVSFERAGAEELPFGPATFDKCLVSFGLHEMPLRARQNALGEIRRVLRPGGSLVLVEYNLPGGWLVRPILKGFVKLAEEEAAYRMLVERSLGAELAESGFAISKREVACRGMAQLVLARVRGAP